MIAGDYVQAERLLRVARKCVSPVSLLNVEYTYLMLTCQEKMHGSLGEEGRQMACNAVVYGELLIENEQGARDPPNQLTDYLDRLRGLASKTSVGREVALMPDGG